MEQKLFIYYNGEIVFDKLSQQEVHYLETKGIVKRKTEYQYELLENNDFKHLFNTKIPFFKRKGYFKRLNQTKLICEDCGKPHSFHIRPAIEKDGSINFKK